MAPKMMKNNPKNTTAETVSSPAIAPPSSQELDFRDPEDDAWYTVSLRLENEGEILKGQDEGLHLRLRVMYDGFDDVEDKRFRAESFGYVSELEEFANRFRVFSPQLQDSECWKVEEDAVVCASWQFGEEGCFKFYDAIVKSVHKSKHNFIKGKETCQCLFDLQWQHGPKRGITTSRTIDCICYIQDQQPKTINLEELDIFLDITRKKLESSPPQHDSITIDNKNALQGTLKQRNQTSKGISCDEEDADLGDGEIYPPWSHSTSAVDPSLAEKIFYVWIENLEIDVLPENIVDFVYKHTSVSSSRALVLPSFCTAFYTRGVISTYTMDEIMKIVKFIHNPSHIIVSRRGRPWVAPEKRWHCGSLGGLLSNLKTNSLPKLDGPGMARINLFSKGTEEFNKGKLLHDLFLEFYNNVRGLNERLTFEERQISMDFRKI